MFIFIYALSSCVNCIYKKKVEYIFLLYLIYRLGSSTPFKRAHTTLASTTSLPNHNLSSRGVYRIYAPMPNTPSNVPINSSTRKPRSYIPPATSTMRMYASLNLIDERPISPFFSFKIFSPTTRYMNSTMNNTNTTLTKSDSNNRDPISSTILRNFQRGKSPMTTANTSLPTHSYYTRSKSVYYSFD